MPKTINCTYDVSKILELIKDKTRPVILDSQTADRELSRYSIISFDPVTTIEYSEQLLVDGKSTNEQPLRWISERLSTNSNNSKLIFSGGFIGHLSYHLLEDIFDIELANKGTVPKINGGIYEQAIIIDHQLETTTIFNNHGDLNELEAILEQSKNVVVTTQGLQQAGYQMLETEESYRTNIEKIKAFIKSGDVYEVNYTTGFKVQTDCSSDQIFNRLRASNPSPYASYLDFGDYSLVSSSPELFYKLEDNYLVTQPMKGTMPRGTDKASDDDNKRLLQTSEKDKIELTMIIDLMRNDVSKIGKSGTVTVVDPFAIKAYQTVFQQVANVCAELKAGIGFEQIITALFPSGSITGAPKLRTIEVIDQLENRGRNSYTGAIGFYSYNQKSVFNVAIRTIEIRGGQKTVNVGGAIVWDSTSSAELAECKTKAKALLAVLGVVDV